MISHGNLINSVSQVFVFTKEARKVQGVRISFPLDKLVVLCTPNLASGMEWSGGHECDF